MRKALAGIVAAACTAVALLGPSPANAQPSSPDAAIGKILSSTKGAQRVDADTVQLAEGVTVQVKALAGGCSYGYLCLFDNADFTGAQYNIRVTQTNACPDIPIDSWFTAKAGSLINNRPSGTVSTLWANSNGTGLLGYQHAYGYRANLALDSAAIGGSWNNRIRSARVC